MTSKERMIRIDELRRAILVVCPNCAKRYKRIGKFHSTPDWYEECQALELGRRLDQLRAEDENRLPSSDPEHWKP